MSLAESIYNKIMERLLAGEILPGQILNRRSLAEEFQVSVAPVLEALVRLEQEGLVETIPRKGTQVRLIRQEDVRGQFILRDAIESKAARLYWGAPLAEGLEELRPLARQVDRAPADHLEDWKTEILFHRELVLLAGVPALTDAFDRSMTLNHFYAMARIIPAREASARDNHEALLERLAGAADPDRAEGIIRAHVWYGKGAIREKKPV